MRKENKMTWPINIRMKEKDFRSAIFKAGSAGMSLEELLEAFLGDLVGRYGHGSDERMYANEYFRRLCIMPMDYICTDFSSYLLYKFEMDSFIENYRDYKDAMEEAEEIFNDIKCEDDPKEKFLLEQARDKVVTYANEQLRYLQDEYFVQFKKRCPSFRGDFEEAASGAMKWYEDMELKLHSGVREKENPIEAD